MRGQPRATTASRPARTRVAYRGWVERWPARRRRATPTRRRRPRDVDRRTRERGVRPRRRELAAPERGGGVRRGDARAMQRLGVLFGVYSDDSDRVSFAIGRRPARHRQGRGHVPAWRRRVRRSARATSAGALIHLAGYLGVWPRSRQLGFVTCPAAHRLDRRRRRQRQPPDTAALLPSMDNFPPSEARPGHTQSLPRPLLRHLRATLRHVHPARWTHRRERPDRRLRRSRRRRRRPPRRRAPILPRARGRRDARTSGDATRTFVDSTGPPERDEHDRVPVLVSSCLFRLVFSHDRSSRSVD